MKRSLMQFLIAAAVVVCVKTTAAAPDVAAPRYGAISMAAWSPDGGNIAFVYAMGGDTEIYIVEADGRGLKNVSMNEAADTNPVWRPDGRALLFSSRRGGQYDICRVDVQGGGRVSTPKKITRSKADDLWPAWSPDGGRIAYCNYEKGYPLVYIIGSNGGAARLFHDKRACHPSFSSDGKKLALTSGGDLIVFKLEEEAAPGGESGGEKEKNITETLIEGNMVDDTLPVWAPRGNKIAFVGRYEAYSSEIYTIGASGKKVRRITDNLFEDLYPRWSPDGKGVVYSAFVGGRPPEIFVSDPESPEKERLTDNHVVELHPCFSPDGKNILYVRRSGGRDELYIMDAKGKNQRPFLGEKEKEKLPTVTGLWKEKEEARKK